jgi:DNA-binding MarR family transcriptional regulator
MCSFQAASLALTAVGTVTRFVGQRRQAEAREQRAEFQAAQARNNRVIAERKAEDAIERGENREDKRRRRLAQQLGAQRTQLAAAGADVGSGTSLDILSDTAATGELDALRIRDNAQREAQGFRTQGANFEGQARLQDQRADAAVGPLTGAGTLLTGAANTAGKAARFKKAGLLSSK